jgi:4-diphosphocytidyl-2-C-methyl-D-erythritol kinase
MEGRFGELPALDWLGLARELGSDVPFFLAKTAALVEGTGERVTALGSLPRWAVLAVKPPVSVSTAQAYASLDARERTLRPRNDSISLQCVQALQRRDLDSVQSLLANDFQEMALEEPKIRRAFDALRDAGAQRPLLTGSGSCVFALHSDESERDAVAARLDLSSDFTVLRTAFGNGSAWRSETAP